VVVPEVQRAYERLGERYTKEQVDIALRKTFLPVQNYNPVSDTWENGYRRLNNLETDVSPREFAAFIDEVIMWCAQELEWQIPTPNEAL